MAYFQLGSWAVQGDGPGKTVPAGPSWVVTGRSHSPCDSIPFLSDRRPAPLLPSRRAPAGASHGCGRRQTGAPIPEIRPV